MAGAKPHTAVADATSLPPPMCRGLQWQWRGVVVETVVARPQRRRPPRLGVAVTTPTDDVATRRWYAGWPMRAPDVPSTPT